MDAKRREKIEKEGIRSRDKYKATEEDKETPYACAGHGAPAGVRRSASAVPGRRVVVGVAGVGGKRKTRAGVRRSSCLSSVIRKIEARGPRACIHRGSYRPAAHPVPKAHGSGAGLSERGGTCTAARRIIRRGGGASLAWARPEHAAGRYLKAPRPEMRCRRAGRVDRPRCGKWCSSGWLPIRGGVTAGVDTEGWCKGEIYRVLRKRGQTCLRSTPNVKMFANETSGAVRSYPPSYSTFSMTSPTRRATSPLVRTRSPTTATPIGAPQVPVPSPEELASTVWPEAEPYPLANASTFQEQIGELRNKMWDSDRFILSAPPAIWADISEKYGETMDCNLFERLEYIDGLIIVTWPDEIHEFISEFTMSPFQQLAARHPDFLCRLNKNIGIPGTTNEPVPDGAVARKPSNGVGLAQYLMVFEWAATQSEVSLDEKARKWFQIPSVQVVVVINVETSPWNRPSAKPKSPTLTYEQFCPKAMCPNVKRGIVIVRKQTEIMTGSSLTRCSTSVHACKPCTA
ncbi:hypothetical protein DFH09DRAFT_1459266 [Mycena vulgaris]|nr:hypothetical protein DFH09DRAFT_1459266 [Mycena vulgaris]